LLAVQYPLTDSGESDSEETPHEVRCDMVFQPLFVRHSRHRSPVEALRPEVQEVQEVQEMREMRDVREAVE
jgi:hypothetical protein